MNEMLMHFSKKQFSQFQKLLISEEFHPQQSLEFTLNGAKNKKHLVSDSSNGKLMRGQTTRPDWFKLAERLWKL